MPSNDPFLPSAYLIGIVAANVLAFVAIVACILALIYFFFVQLRYPGISPYEEARRNPWQERSREHAPQGLASKIKRGISYATQDVGHAAVVLIGPLALIFIVRLLVQWQVEQKAWQQVFADAWDSFWFLLAAAAFLLLGLGFLRKHPPLSNAFMRFCIRVVIVLGLLLLFSPFLFRVGENVIQHTSTPHIGWFAQKSSDEFIPGVIQKDGKVYATLTGREEKGLTVLFMPPGSTYQVCYVKGRITSYWPTTKNDTPEEMWGNSAGYVLYNQQRDALDWGPNFRYSKLTGVLPYATLVVRGGIGSGREQVVPFPAKRFCADANNNSKEVRELNLYYHALQFFWWQENDDYAFPTQTSAVRYGRTRSVKYDGWLNQGKDGSTETFVVMPIP